MLRADKLDVDLAMILVIDLQEKLLPSIAHHERVIAVGAELLDGARVFGLPVLATEQYPKGLGPTDASIRQRLESAAATVLEKPTFSACDQEPLRAAMRVIERPQVIVIGIEAHVCVQQTVLDLRAMDYDVFVCADAVGSRTRRDYKYALHRMRQAGVFVTTVESVLFELCNRCDTDRFKELLKVIKANPPVEE